jgi:hypothetical protein
LKRPLRPLGRDERGVAGIIPYDSSLGGPYLGAAIIRITG